MTAQQYANLRIAIPEKANNVPSHDLWIGALALQHSIEVLSRDTHFDRMPGIRRVEW